MTTWPAPQGVQGVHCAARFGVAVKDPEAQGSQVVSFDPEAYPLTWVPAGHGLAGEQTRSLVADGAVDSKVPAAQGALHGVQLAALATVLNWSLGQGVQMRSLVGLPWL